MDSQLPKLLPIVLLKKYMMNVPAKPSITLVKKAFTLLKS